MSEALDLNGLDCLVGFENGSVMKDVAVSTRVVMAGVRPGNGVVEDGQGSDDWFVFELNAPSMMGGFVGGGEIDGGFVVIGEGAVSGVSACRNERCVVRLGSGARLGNGVSVRNGVILGKGVCECRLRVGRAREKGWSRV